MFSVLRIFRVWELPVYLREALLSRINPMLWHTLFPLLLLALRRWLSQPSSHFSDFLRLPIQLNSGLSCSPCACSRPNLQQILFFLRLDGGWGQQTPLIGKWEEGSFVRFFQLIDILGKFPRVSAGTSLLSCSLLLISVPKLHSAGTSLIGNFDLYFTKRWNFIFSDVCLTQCSARESYSSNWSQHFWALPGNRCGFWRLNVLWYATQLSYILHWCYCTLVTIYCKYLSRRNYTAVDWTSPTGFILWRFFFSTHFYFVFLELVAQRVARFFGVGFARSSPHWSPFEHCLFSFHW